LKEEKDLRCGKVDPARINGKRIRRVILICGGQSMAALTIPWQITGRTLRQLGWLLAALLAVAGHLLIPSTAALALELSGAAVFAISTVRPIALRLPLLVLLVVLWPLVWLVLRLLRPYWRPGLASDLATSTARRLRPRRRLPQS
jgi:hypothetical protein